MGKIRVKMLGDESKAKKQYKPKEEKKKEAKTPGLKGGERARLQTPERSDGGQVVSVGPSTEELEKEEKIQAEDKSTKESLSKSKTRDAAVKEKKEKFKKALKKQKSGHRYQANAGLVSKNTPHSLDKAIVILKKFKKAKFDETVELHVNVKEKGISGQVSLPHGTGKQIRIKLADDAIIDAVSKGKIDFDILIAEPAIMPKLAKVARILGPKGLMPNPKAGTITTDPKKLIEKLSKGQINFKTETDMPIIHMSVGKLSFTEKQITENVNSALSAIGSTIINNVTLKSTMSPAIKLQIQ